MKFRAAVVVVAILITAYWYAHRPLRYAPGILIHDDPGQIMLPQSAPPIVYGNFALKPLAMFSVDARVLHRRNYRYDIGAALVPVDLALGWGPMSDQAVIDQLNITQSMRFYWYEYKLPPPIPAPEIVSHSANMHIIPATPEIAARCKSLRAGSLVRLTGDLVEASGPGIPRWRSSLSRTDTGNGACELFYVEQIDDLVPDSANKSQIIAKQ